MTKQIEKFLMVILVLTIIAMILPIVWPNLLSRFIGAKEYGQISMLRFTIAYLFLLPRALIGLCVAIWLANAAERYGLNRTGWFVLGLFLGVIALVVFYIVRIHEMIETQTHKPA